VLSLWLLLAATAAPSITIDGEVVDAMVVRRGALSEVWLSTADRRGRRLVRVSAGAQALGPALAIAPEAIFVDACPDGRVVYADAHGLLDESGARVLEARALFTVPDPRALLVADLCGKSGEGRNELRLPVVDGIAIRGARGASSTLRFAHDARAYSGRVHRGLRPDRGYAEALSLYGPRLLDADIDGDGHTDVVAIREGRLSGWLRAAGALSREPAVERNLNALVRAGDDADLRVRLVDLDGDKRVEAVIGVTRGAVPERSEAWVLEHGEAGTRGATLFARARPLWQREGLVAAIGDRGRTLVVAEIDTSLVSLSAVVLTGRIPVKVGLEGKEALTMQAKVDVRAGRMDGALPVVQVDFDKDGIPDLLDLGVPGRAALHLGAPAGFALDPVVVWDVPPFVNVVAMPELHGVVLIGAAHKGRTRVSILTRGGAR
jgi:hypothetical protein